MFGLFKQRADRNCLIMAGKSAGALLEGRINSCGLMFETDLEKIDLAIRQNSICQMLIVSLTTSLGNYTLQDAYHDAGFAGPLSPMPELKFHHDDSRLLIQHAFEFFPTCRMNLDMRYRYVMVQKLMSTAEAEIWQSFESWTGKMARTKFQYRQELDTYWIGFIERFAGGDQPAAMELMRESYQRLM